MMFTVSNGLLVLQQILSVSDLFNIFLVYLQPLTKVFGVVAVKHAYDFSEFSRKKTSSRIETLMRNQYNSAGHPKIDGPGNREFSEELCRHRTPLTHVFCRVASSKTWMGSKARRSCSVLQVAWRSSLCQVFGCVVSALHHVSFTFPVSPTCVRSRKCFEIKLASAFLLSSLSMAGGGSVSEGALADFE